VKDADATAEWTPPPMPMIEPDKEGPALRRLVRIGAMTPDEMVRQQGLDPDAHWDAYEKNIKGIRARGITLDIDVAAVSDAGLTQERGGGQKQPADPADDPPADQ